MNPLFIILYSIIAYSFTECVIIIYNNSVVVVTVAKYFKSKLTITSLLSYVISMDYLVATEATFHICMIKHHNIVFTG